MGNDPPQKPKPTLEDSLIQMKMSSKRMAKESQKAMKDSQKYIKKAKETLKKNNQDGAKLYLQSASSKRSQALNLQRLSMKMQFIAANMKNMNSSQAIMASFQKMTQIASQNNPDFQLMSNSITSLQTCIDDILINGKMMQEMMSQNIGTDNTVENMMDTLKKEVAIQDTNQVNQAAAIRQKEMEQLEKIRKL